MKNNFFISVILGTMLLCFISFMVELPFGVNWDVNYLFWMFFSNFLITFFLGLLIKNSVLNGLKLALMIFIVYSIIGNFNILIEAYIFNVTDRNETIQIMLQGFILALITSPLLVYVFKKSQPDDILLSFKPRSILQWIWRIVLADLLYLFFYLLAGFILYTVYPRLMEFYGDKVPDFSLMINTQFFRALLFIGVAIIIGRYTNTSIFKRALLTGAVFSILGGIAPLILPGDEVMPGFIRFGHAFEVGISNFLYGLILTYLIGQKIIHHKAHHVPENIQLSNQI
jgi:hypothetical protein